MRESTQYITINMRCESEIAKNEKDELVKHL